MSDKIYVGNKVVNVDATPSPIQYSKVILNVSEDVSYTSGNDTYETLEITCPFGTQEIADSILSKIQSVQYQPYKAESAVFDPAVELGDGVTIAGLYSVIYRQKLTFDHLMESDIEAPHSSDIDHEIPFETAKNREFSRRINGAYSEITQTATEIRSEVAGKIDGEDAQSLIDQTLEGVTLSVSNASGTTTFVLKSGNVTLDTETVDLHVKSVNVDGTITADAINLSTATITGQLTATNIDATNLHVSGANIDNLTVTNAQIQSLDADKINVNGKTLGSTGILTSLDTDLARIHEGAATATLGGTNVSHSATGKSASWVSIIDVARAYNQGTITAEAVFG